MKKVIINVAKESDEQDRYIENGGYGMYDISFQINLNDKKFKEILLNKSEWIKNKKYDISMRIDLGDEYDCIEEEYNYIIDNIENIYDVIDLISIEKDIDINDFLSENPELKSKKIVLKEYLEISDFDKIEKLYEKYKIIDAYVGLQGNMEHISLKQCMMTMNYIKNIGDTVASLNLSPFETILYVYDIVRDRYYNYENEDDRHTVSRDLTKVLFGDAIVCLGYAQIFKSILTYLGFNNEIEHLKVKGKNEGHARNEVIINDPKYNINGIYYFDTTWDSKKKGKEDEFLLSYKYAARTRDEMEIFENKRYEYTSSPRYSHNFLNEFEKVLKERNFMEFFPYIKTFNYLNYATDGNCFIEYSDFINNKVKFEDIRDNIKKMLNELNKPINAETFLNAINEVRKNEYYIDSEKYSYDFEDFYCILMNSNWNFENHHYKPSEKLFMAIFGENNSNNTKEEDLKNFIYFDSNILNDIESIRLTKVLRKELERRK